MNLIDQLKQIEDYGDIREKRHELWLVLLVIFPVRFVVGKHTPCTTCRQDIKDCIYHCFHVNTTFSTTFLAAGINPDSSSHCSDVKLLGYDGFMALVTLSYLRVFSTALADIKLHFLAHTPCIGGRLPRFYYVFWNPSGHQESFKLVPC